MNLTAETQRTRREPTFRRVVRAFAVQTRIIMPIAAIDSGIPV